LNTDFFFCSFPNRLVCIHTCVDSIQQKKSTSAIKWPRDKTFRSLVAASSLRSPSSLILSISIEKWQQQEDKQNKNNTDDIISTRVSPLFFFILDFFSFSLLLSLAKQGFFYSVVGSLLLLQVYTIHLYSIRTLHIKHIFPYTK